MAGRDCDEALSQLYEFLDGELTDERRVTIQAHLHDCGPCLEAAEFEQHLQQVLADRCRDTVPESLRQRIAAAIEAESG